MTHLVPYAGASHFAMTEYKESFREPTKFGPKPVRDILDLKSGRRMTSADVLNVIMDVSEMSMDDLRGDYRARGYIRARFACFVLLAKYCPHLSGVRRSRVLRRDHTCEMNARQRHPGMMLKDAEYALLYEQADQQLSDLREERELASATASEPCKIVGETA